MKSSIFYKLTVVLAFLGLAACNAFGLSMHQIPRGIVGTYSADIQSVTSMNFRVQSDGYVGNYCVVLTQTGFSPTPISPAQAPAYQLYQPANLLTNRLATNGSPTDANQVLSGYFSAGAGNSVKGDFSVALVIPTNPLPPPGNYLVQLRADLYPAVFLPSGTPADSANFSLTITVPQSLDVSVVPGGGAFAINANSQSLGFSPLAEGSRQSADLLVRANVGHSLFISSGNNWALVNTGDGTRIDYEVTSNGQNVPTSAGAAISIAAGAQATWATPSRYSLGFTILALPDIPTEGVYLDTITVTLTAP